MKIAKLVKEIKKNRRIITRCKSENNSVWIGSSYALYPLYGMPFMRDDQVLTLLDIPLKDHDKYLIQDICGEQRNKLIDSLKDISRNKNDGLLSDGFLIDTNSESFLCFKFKEGIKFIKTTALEIIDYEDDSCVKYIKYIDDTIIISNGFVPMAIIKCYDAISEELVNKYKTIFTLFDEALTQKKEKEILETTKTLNQIDFEMLSETE